MQRQLERYKGKHYRGRGDGHAKVPAVPAVSAEDTEEKTDIISRHKTFDLIPMNEGEALEQMKLLGHDNFFIFINIKSRNINVIYRRRDGTYGIIEPRS
jgi:putative sigma-54 modulation protein